jgi:hypothetical protein
VLVRSMSGWPVTRRHARVTGLVGRGPSRLSRVRRAVLPEHLSEHLSNLQAAFGTKGNKCVNTIDHWIHTGRAEGRQGSP